MFTKTYLINFDKSGLLDNFDYNQFHNSLTTAKGILNWWHYLESSYIIVVSSDVSATAISEYVRQIMPNKHLFIVEVDLKNHNGWLPNDAWEWINKHNNNPWGYLGK